MNSPIGPSPRVEAEKSEWRVHAKGKGSNVKRMGAPRPPRTINVGLDILSPNAPLRIAFLCVKPEPWGIAGLNEDSKSISYHILGTCQFEFRGEYVPRKFIAQLAYDEINRHVTSDAVVDDDGTLPVEMRMEM